MAITSYEHLSLIEDILIGCYRKLNRKEKIAIQQTISTCLNHIELLLAIGKAGTKLTTRQIKKRGGGGGIKNAWVVEMGVTHTISQKNPNGTYSKKKFKTPHEARLASLKYAEEIKRMIQSYKETKLTDEQWLDGLEYFDRSGRKKGSGS
jgi:hypothetical protein